MLSEKRSKLFLLYQIFGFFPFNVDSKNFLPYESKFISKFLIIFLLCLVVPFITSYKEREFFLTSKKSRVSETVDFMQLVLMRMSSFIFVFESFLHKKDLMKYFKNLHEVEKLFKKLGIELNFKAEQKRHSMVISVVMIFYTLTELVVLLCYYMRDSVETSLYWVLYIPFFIHCCLRYLQFMNFILIIKKRVDIVNSELINIFQLTSESQRTLEVLRKICYELYGMSFAINNTFGLSTLINMTNDFITVTLNSYFISVSFEDLNRKTRWKIVESIFWSLPHCMNIIALATCCQLSLQSTYKTALHVHRINHRNELEQEEKSLKNIFYLEFSKIKIRSSLKSFPITENQSLFMSQFSLQLLHQKIQYTAFGFVNIDFTLLYGMAATATTYLVILIQFHQSEKN